MNKVIIFGDDHHNTLGVVWSFAKVGIKPIIYMTACLIWLSIAVIYLNAFV